ncbi:hypothetical protein L6164_035795 [Bauhinia variegata]|uniref:Uncharacterized protein n=1 Tax=Bauhinia variegata TaxID=167791 RepID=A0ACB9KF72_BAUVA|nr:hypothetical protein L6164_035795 [Bauhinia variegata]
MGLGATTILRLRVEAYQIFLSLILLLLLSLSAAQSIVKTLPGFSGELPFVLETGYIGVGEHDKVHLFYYFIDSEVQPADDPLVLWLTGGPGCSALSGPIYEIGPLSFDYKNSREGKKPVLVLNDYSWTMYRIQHLQKDTTLSDAKSVAHAYEFLTKWLLAHPDFHTNPEYIAGDSHSGIIIPPLVEKFWMGYVLGNPFTDFIYDVNSRVKFAHRLALISDEMYEGAKVNCRGDAYSPEPKIFKWDSSPLGVHSSKALLSDANPIGGPWCRNHDYLFIYIWANDKAVQEALHVINGTITEWI